MKVMLAGATGALGGPLIHALRDAGHEVVALARTHSGAERAAGPGVTAVKADVLDRDALLRAVDGHHVDAVIHELTALKKAPIRHRDMFATNALRTQGSTHLIEAAQQMGATRFLTQSIAFGYGYRDHGPESITEDSPFGEPHADAFDPHLAARRSAEQQAFAAAGMEGVALRYGLFYGADLAGVVARLRKRALPIPRHGGDLAFVHHDDAATATVAALHRGRAGEAYNVVDDQPAGFGELLSSIATAYRTPTPLVLPAGLLRIVAPYGGAVMTTVSMRVSNAKARTELGWTPRYGSYRDFLGDPSSV